MNISRKRNNKIFFIIGKIISSINNLPESPKGDLVELIYKDIAKYTKTMTKKQILKLFIQMFLIMSNMLDPKSQTDVNGA
jgi:hypothetical protein